MVVAMVVVVDVVGVLTTCQHAFVLIQLIHCPGPRNRECILETGGETGGDTGEERSQTN